MMGNGSILLEGILFLPQAFPRIYRQRTAWGPPNCDLTSMIISDKSENLSASFSLVIVGLLPTNQGDTDLVSLTADVLYPSSPQLDLSQRDVVRDQPDFSRRMDQFTLIWVSPSRASLGSELDLNSETRVLAIGFRDLLEELRPMHTT